MIRTLSLLVLLAGGLAHAQEFPSRPVRLVVPFPAGGAVDTLARQVQPKMAEGFGQQVIIENRAGAGGAVGTAAVAKSPPDGYTLLMVFDTHAVNPSIMKELPFDTVKDLAPVSLVATSPLALVANNQVPARTLQELIALARKAPGTVAYASVGAGSLGHLGMTSLSRTAGVEMIHVPYKGGAPAVTDLLGGQVQLFLTTTFVAKPLVDSGKARPLAVTSRERSPSLPSVPTVAESGYPGFEVMSWFGLLAPAGTPRLVVERVRAELARALQDPQVRERLTGQALTLVGSTPDEFGRFLMGEIERWGRVVRENNITAN